MDRYAEAVTGVVPSANVIGAVIDIAAALVPPAVKAGAPAMVVSPKEPMSDKLKKFAPHAVGLAAGAFFWKKHRILGALAGHALVNSAYEYYKGDKKKAMCDLAVEGAGVAGALYHKKLPLAGKSPVIGWAMGIVAGSVGTYFVDGSPAKEHFQWLKARIGK